MSVNLMSKYADKLELKMRREALVWGKAKGGYSWDGVKTVKSITPVTQNINNYNQDAVGSRFGALTEVEDTEHTYTLQYSISNNMAIDKEYNTEQKMLKRASEILKYQIEQVYVPYMDKEALTKYVSASGIETKVDGELTTSTAIGAVKAARTAMINNHVFGNGKDLVMWVKPGVLDLIAGSSEFINWEKIGTKAFVDGSIGRAAAFSIIEVPDDIMPAGVNFVAANLNCLMNPEKFRTLRILDKHPDVDGAVLQPHFVFGAFVNATNAKGVYVSRSEAASV